MVRAMAATADNPARDADDIAFGKIPLAMVTAGTFAGLTRSCLAVYLAIAGHVNGVTWQAWPTIPTIARCAGVTHRTVQRATARLEQLGLIMVERGGSLSGVGRLTGFSSATFFKTLNNQGTNPSSIVIMHWLERHYGITIEGDPYR